MKKIVLFALAFAASGFALACSSDDSSTGDAGPDTGIINDTGTPDTSKTDSGGDAGNPPPTLKTQVDRMGRPAVNTALNHAFDGTSAAGTAKDAYNADKNVAGWSAAYIGQIEANLAILDSLDGVCGNQLAYSMSTHYATLAGLFADDRLYLDTSKSTCTTYLGVELNATTLIPNMDCGGRTLTEDVIDETYSAAAIGAPSGVTDGIGAVTAKTNGTMFPYLAPAQ